MRFVGLSWLRAVKVPVRRSGGAGLLPVGGVEAVGSRVIVGRLVRTRRASLEGGEPLLLVLIVLN